MCIRDRLYATGYQAESIADSKDKHKTKVRYDVPVDFITYQLSQTEVSKFNAKFNTNQ